MHHDDIVECCTSSERLQAYYVQLSLRAVSHSTSTICPKSTYSPERVQVHRSHSKARERDMCPHSLAPENSWNPLICCNAKSYDPIEIGPMNPSARVESSRPRMLLLDPALPTRTCIAKHALTAGKRHAGW